MWLLAVAAGVALSGCELGDTSVASNNDAPSFDDCVGTIYKEPWEGGVYIVNGDEAVTNEKKLREFHGSLYGSNGALLVHRSGNADAAWNSTQKKNLTYCVSNAFGQFKAQIVQSMNEATAAWEAAADVDFVHLTAQDANCTANNQAVLFDVRLVTGQPYLARAFFPGERRSARNILVDQSSFGNLGAITVTGILRHELGHTLGFRHEHTRPEAGTCFEDNNWRALTAYDSASVMHYPQCNGTGVDLSLTALDIQGATGLYGAAGSTDPTPPQQGTPQQVIESDTINQGQIHQYDPVAVLPGSQFVAQLSGTGDADLYVRFNSAPTRRQFDCRPYLVSSNEICALDVPAGATTAHITVDGYTAANYTLQVNWVQP